MVYFLKTAHIWQIVPANGGFQGIYSLIVSLA